VAPFDALSAALAPFRHAWPHLRRRRGALLLGVACLLPSTAIDLAIPWWWKEAIDEAIAGVSDAASLTGIVALAVVAGLASGALKYALRRVMVGASRDFENDLRLALHRRLLERDPSWHERHPVGDLTSRLAQDVEAVRMALGPGTMYVLSAVLAIVSASIAMFVVSPALTGWMAAPLVLLGAAALKIAPRLGRASDDVQRGIADLSACATESFAGVRVLKAFCGEERQGWRMEQLSRRYFEAQLSLARARGTMIALLFLVKDAALFVILLVGGLHILAGRATIGHLVLFRDWLLLCFWPLVTLGWIVAVLQRAAAGMRRIAEVLEPDPMVATTQPPATLESRAHSIEWRGVTVRRGGRRILDQVSLKVPAGGSLGLTGRIGAGKTTLLELLPRFTEADSGTVLLDDVDVRRLDPAALRSRVAIVPQDPFLFSETLRENLRFGRPDADDAALLEVARHAGLDEDLARIQGGLEARLGERGVTLSGGQRQRATLARALLRGGGVLLIDDAFSAVDAATEARILEGLAASRAGRTTLVVSHRVHALTGLDRVAVLDEGRVIEEGPPSELLSRDGPFARLLRAQRLEAELEAS
jgi:ATP-binding cassette subfamily B protein